MMIYEHIDGVKVAAQFAWEGDLYFRYRLEIKLHAEMANAKTVGVVMQNPSYAGEDVADKSVQFLEKVVFQKALPEFNGVNRVIIVNQFARIKTNDFIGLPEEIGRDNDAVIATALQESDIVVVAWGSSNRFENRKKIILGLLGNMRDKQLFKTKMHPSRGQYDGFIQEFEV